MTLKIAVLTAYVLTIVIIGIVRSKKTSTFHEFFLGGGNIGPWMTAFTYGAAYFSAVLFIGFSGKIGWQFGYSGLWIAVGNALVGTLLVWWVLGARVKQMSQELGISTMSEYLELRYHSRFLKFFSSSSIFLFFIPYSAAVFIGLSYLFQLNFGTEFWHALAFMGLFTAVYMVLGGYKSMTMIDVFFGFLMLAGGAVFLWSVLDKAGGLVDATARLTAVDPRLTGLVGPPGWWPLFCLVFLTSIAPFAMPQLVQKFYAIRDQKAIKAGMWISTAFAIILSTIAYFAGAFSRLLLTPENSLGAFKDGSPIFDALVPELIAKAVSPSLIIFILLLILSASMSTLAALVLISSSSVAKDLVAGFINPGISDRNLTRLMRVLSVVFILLSVIFAYFRPATIVSILGISWGAIGAIFLGPFLWGLFWSRTNALGAITSSIVALVVCLGMYLAGRPSPEAGTVGMMISFATTPLFSLFSPKK
ncbi:sodium:solute symporter [bacterium]|nr:sodium:solute symporter [bacterium]